VCGLVYKKYRMVATTTNSPTGIAKVMMDPARVQSLPKSARIKCCTPASC